jgi:beta-lactamase regulating signal transducer with metallopeptidase domain
MNVVDALAALMWHSLVLSAAVALVLLLRPLLLRLGGAGAAYALWALVPTAAVGAAVGAVVASVSPSSVVSTTVPLSFEAPWASALTSTVPARGQGLVLWSGVVLLVWALVAAGLALRMVRLHQKMRALISRGTTGYARLPAGTSPAVVGAWRPVLCVPQDFEARFDAAQQQLMLAHEQVHLARHDTRINLVAAVLHTVHWFNPLAWWALRRMRADQELACDAATLRSGVLAADPNPVAMYAATLVKAQGLYSSGFSPPVASAWHNTHPFIERIAMLKTHRVSTQRRNIGRSLAAALCVLALGAAHSLQPSQPPASAAQVQVSMTLDIDGKPIATPRLVGALGSTMSIRMAPDRNSTPPDALAEPLALDVTASAHGANQLQAQLVLHRGEPLRSVAQPRLVGAEGETLRIEHRLAPGSPLLGVSLVMRRVAQAPAAGATR